MTRLITALDGADARAALALVERLEPALTRLKVGNELFTAAGPGLVETLQRRGFEVFLDLKYHDIPNTVASACARAAALGVWMVNVHAGGGRRMLEAARAAVPPAGGALQPEGERVGVERDLSGDDGGRPPVDGAGGASGRAGDRDGGSRPRDALDPIGERRDGGGTRLIAVTVLTSLAREDLAETGLEVEPEAQVRRLAALARDTGLDGVVCSPREIGLVRTLAASPFLTVTPGIRPDGGGGEAPALVSRGGAADDQRRTLTPREAILAGADHLVVGRAVTQAAEPVAALEAISAEVGAALAERGDGEDRVAAGAGATDGGTHHETGR